MIYRLDRLEGGENNPITGQAYDSAWRVMVLTSNRDYRQLVGKQNGVYTIQISRILCPDWRLSVGDFCGFCEENHCSGIVVMGRRELDDALKQYVGHSFREAALREGEPKVLIHSTPAESWKKIQACGMLKCWNLCQEEGLVSELHPIGRLLGDPADFSDYIMFGGGIAGEIVVSSRQRGEIWMDSTAGYHPGARLYFDSKKIAQDGLLMRDGCHLKVKRCLSLEPYLIWKADWKGVGLKTPVSSPERFAQLADRRFGELFPQYPL